MLATERFTGKSVAGGGAIREWSAPVSAAAVHLPHWRGEDGGVICRGRPPAGRHRSGSQPGHAEPWSFPRRLQPRRASTPTSCVEPRILLLMEEPEEPVATVRPTLRQTWRSRRDQVHDRWAYRLRCWWTSVGMAVVIAGISTALRHRRLHLFARHPNHVGGCGGPWLAPGLGGPSRGAPCGVAQPSSRQRGGDGADGLADPVDGQHRNLPGARFRLRIDPARDRAHAGCDRSTSSDPSRVNQPIRRR